MNETICKGCKRYKEMDGSWNRWQCAERLDEVRSQVVPGHIVTHQSNFKTIYKYGSKPPEWCGFVLEQTLVGPDEKIEVSPAEKKKVVRIDQEEAEYWLKQQEEKPKGLFPRRR